MTEFGEQVRMAAADILRWHPVPGGLVVAVAPDRTLLTVPFGHADPQRRVPVVAEHLFEIGSISKLLTSLLVGQLVDDGAVRLADRLVDHLPWFAGGQYTNEITVLQLLSHTAGLIGGSDAVPDGAAQVWALRERSAAPPGRHFHYSNVGYLALGELVRAVCGEPHWAVLARRVFEPLGISGGLVRVLHGDRSRLAVGSCALYDDRPWLPGDPLSGATFLEVDGADGNVALDAAGIAALLRLLLGGGEVDGRRVVSAQSWQRLVTETAPGGEDVMLPAGGAAVTSSRYGLGINVERVAGAQCLTHGGGMIGYSGFVLADVSNSVAVGVLTNGDGECPAAQILARYVHGVVTGAAPDVLDSDPTVRTGGPADLVAGLYGTDRSGADVAVGLRTETSTGRVLVHAGGADGALYRDLYGRLATDHPELRLHFLRTSTGARAVPTDELPTDTPPTDTLPTGEQCAALVGHYRAHTPWFANFRIVARSGRLFLTACHGVEAPIAEQELVPLGDPAAFRVGAAPWLPERLTCLAVVSGRAVLLDLDGCAYSRTATP